MKAEPIALTRRNGERIAYRSKLEARWSLFFDELGFTWQYEPFRFLLDGKKFTYTPDFEVDGVGIIEVKPTWEMLADSITRIAPYIAKTKNRVLVLYGSSPISSGAAILHDSPIEALFLDRMQTALVLGGRQRWQAAKENYDALHISVFGTLDRISKSKLRSEGLTLREISALNDTREDSVQADIQRTALLNRLLSKSGKGQAA